jgi:hypothetical protein
VGLLSDAPTNICEHGRFWSALVAKTVGRGSRRMQNSEVSLTRNAVHLLRNKRIFDSSSQSLIPHIGPAFVKDSLLVCSAQFPDQAE